MTVRWPKVIICFDYSQVNILARTPNSPVLSSGLCTWRKVIQFATIALKSEGCPLSREEKQRYDELLQQYRELQQSIVEKPARIYTKDFIYFVVSMLLPLGYGEVDLISRASVWHVVFGWLCWAVPLFVACHILWRKLSSKQISLIWRLLVTTVIAMGFLGLATKSVSAFLNRQREEQQEEVKRNLVPSVLPPLTENIMESVFSVTNKSSKTTIGEECFFAALTRLSARTTEGPYTSDS